MGSSSDPLHLLPEPVLEKALSYLPLPSILSTSSTCKFLCSLLSSPHFARLYGLTAADRSPWFFLFGLNHLIPSKNQCFALDPVSLSWVRLPFLPPPPHNHSSLASSNALLFALSGADQDRLCFSPSPLRQGWTLIRTPMRVPRKQPLVALLSSSAGGPRLAVIGGAEDPREEHEVELYDEAAGVWQRGQPMPIHDAGSLSSAVLRGRIYVADCYSGKIGRMDGASGRWISADVERPVGAKWWNLVAVESDGFSGLVAVVVCARVGVKIVMLDEGTMKVKRELGAMPAELFRMLNSPGGGSDDVGAGECGWDDQVDDGADKHLTLRCVGGGMGVIYIYSTSRFASRCPMVVIMCRIQCPSSNGHGGCSWIIPPLLPPNVNRFDHLICLASNISLGSCLTHSYQA